MNKDVLKTIKIIIIAFICVALMISNIVSSDLHHLDNCKEEHCEKCSIIHMAQSITKLFVSIILFILISFNINKIISKIKNAQDKLNSETLVYLKVQFNE